MSADQTTSPNGYRLWSMVADFNAVESDGCVIASFAQRNDLRPLVSIGDRVMTWQGNEGCEAIVEELLEGHSRKWAICRVRPDWSTWR